MSEPSLEQKQAQFDEYFSIAYRMNVNVRPLEDDEDIPDEDAIEERMPYAFRIASEMASIEAQAIRPLRNLSDHAESLADYLNHQARKIDLMMSFVLHQQDEPKHRFHTVKFGGGGVVIESDTPLEVGSHAELKLFLNEEAAAIFCFVNYLQYAFERQYILGELPIRIEFFFLLPVFVVVAFEYVNWREPTIPDLALEWY